MSDPVIRLPYAPGANSLARRRPPKDWRPARRRLRRGLFPLVSELAHDPALGTRAPRPRHLRGAVEATRRVGSRAEADAERGGGESAFARPGRRSGAALSTPRPRRCEVDSE